MTTSSPSPPTPSIISNSNEDAVQMGQLLAALTQPDTATIRQAEVALKPLLKDPRSVPALLAVLEARDSQPEAVRHVAAIVLRKRLASHYENFGPQEKDYVKKQTLQLLHYETARTVRHGIVNVVAVLAKCCISSSVQEWPELFDFISSSFHSPHVELREASLWTLQEMTETVGMHLKPQFGDMQLLFGKALQDPSNKVQMASVKACGQLLQYLADEPQVETFASLLPQILQIAQTTQEEEDVLASTLDVLYDLAYSPHPVFGTYVPQIVNFCLVALQNTQLEMTTRDSAALVIATMAEAKPKTFGKHQALLDQTLEVLLNLIQNSNESAAGALFDSNPAWKADLDHGDGDHDDDDDDSPTETSMAQGTLDMMVCEIPKRYIFELTMQKCIARLQGNANSRKAGIAALGVAAEGCAEPLRQHLAQLMPILFRAAQDEAPQVRECACFCLGQVSEHCQPEVLAWSDQILPIVFQLLDDANVAVQATSCYVLEMFCERLEPSAVRPLLDSLVRKLATMLETTQKRSVQEMVVAALAATAVAAEEEFAPYVDGIAGLMQKCMELQDPNLYSLRGRALECMGHMAIAVGKETFRPYFQTTMKCAVEGLTFDSTELHEFAYAVFANLSKVMQDEFAPVLPELVPHLLVVVNTDEGQLEAVAAASNEEQQLFQGLNDSDDEDNGDGEDGGNYVLHVRTALLEAKKGAITALGEMAAHVGAAFCPYLEQTMTVLQKAANNWHPLIKTEVAEALASMVVPLIALHGPVEWTKGDHLTTTHVNNPMPPDTDTLVKAVIKEFTVLQKDDDKGTVGKACEGIQSVIELCGPHAIMADAASEILENTYNLLTKKAPCHSALYAYEDDGQEEDDDDHDTMMTSVCDLVGSFARVFGTGFVTYLPQFLPAICEYAKSSRPPSDRSMAMGCLSEMAQELETGIAPYWSTVFMPAILAGLEDTDDNVKRNSAFCLGLCCEHLGEGIGQQYPQLLQSLSPIFAIQVESTSSSSAAPCVDNAAAALSRMIMACPSQVPLDQVLPVLLSVLPLKSDMTENETVYTCLLGLLQLHQSTALANKEELKRVFTQACAPDSGVEEEVQTKLKLALQAF